MITPEKLQTLPPKTMLRKILTLMETWEQKDSSAPVPPTGRYSDREYRCRVLKLLRDRKDLLTAAQLRAVEELLELLEPLGPLEPVEAPGPGEPPAAVVAAARAKPQASEHFLRLLHHLRYGIMEKLGIAPADWDFYDEERSRLSRKAERVLPIRLFLDDIRSPYNVGSIFRTAEAFGVEGIILSEHTASPTHKRALRTSMGCTEILPWEISSLEEISKGRPVFALELGGVELKDFVFPPSGIAVIGSEELGISPETRHIARESAGIVSIPLRGAKASLNVATAAGILLHAWVGSLARR